MAKALRYQKASWAICQIRFIERFGVLLTGPLAFSDRAGHSPSVLQRAQVLQQRRSVWGPQRKMVVGACVEAGH
jgi:hypothetical protein